MASKRTVMKNRLLFSRKNKPLFPYHSSGPGGCVGRELKTSCRRAILPLSTFNSNLMSIGRGVSPEAQTNKKPKPLRRIGRGEASRQEAGKNLRTKKINTLCSFLIAFLTEFLQKIAPNRVRTDDLSRVKGT